MLRWGLIVGLAWGGASAFAGEKEEVCAQQAAIFGAVQTARLDRVPRGKVVDQLVAANPDWNEKVQDSLPLVVEQVYALRRRDLKLVDLAEQTETVCLEQYDELKDLSGS